jgi:hypothetical protein
MPLSREGTEHITPDDTLDGDYGRIVAPAYDRLYGKG